MKAGHNQAATHAASPDVAVPVSLAACHAAWLKARRGKRPSANQLAFEAGWLDRLLDLKTALRAGVWQPRRTVSFIVSHPKTREIHAPDFADRVVHHILVERLEKIYEPIFIHDSYANRKGKGSHAAVDRLQQFMRSRNGQGWYMQLDIHNCFNSINRHILYRMVCKRIEQCERRGNRPFPFRGKDRMGVGSFAAINPIPTPTLPLKGREAGRGAPLPGAHALALRSLCHKLLANKVTECVRDPAAAARLPAHKRLAHAQPGCGLPVGNLSSQFFANVYLNALDQFVKHKLKCSHYVRYVDDFVLLATTSQQLQQWQAQIEEFLATTLRLKLKDAVLLQPLCQGIDFLGYRVFAGHRRVRPRVVQHCKAKLTAWAMQHVKQTALGITIHALPPALDQLQAMLASYWGHFEHAHSVRLRHAIFERFAWLKILFALTPSGQLHARWVLQGETVARQTAELRALWPGAVCLIQKGYQCMVWQPLHAQPATPPQRVHARQTGWLRHGTRRREISDWFIPQPGLFIPAFV
ncbi:MAG: hypothetical protein A3K04_00135 [Gallionellales bacterium RBG_16_56_9]|nr:MAG: hypothetical protein A3K04_00135 [Gallionellales bacterium RBG_16_56_9]